MMYFDEIKVVYHLNIDDTRLIKLIEEKLSRFKPEKRQIYRQVYSSLVVEDILLSIETIKDIAEGKMMLGSKKDVISAKNLVDLYENMNSYNYKSEEDFLKAHKVLMECIITDNGIYRNHGEGVKKGNEIIYRAPESILVPSLMKSLFNIFNEDKIHPLVKASIFHYYFVYIHPFSDGNGRMARFWVSLILTNWNSKFMYIPIEEELYLNQEEYYSSINKCHINGNANVFISFMLKCINNILDKTTQETTQEK